MKISIFLVVILAVAASSATLQKRSTPHSASINDYVDRTVKLIQSYIVTNQYDSISLPDVTQRFSYKPLLITYSGRLSLFNGVLSDLNTIRRFGDVNLNYDSSVLGVDFDVGVDQLRYTYDFSAKFLGVSHSGSVTGSLKKIDVLGNVAMDLSSYKLALNSFKINSVDSISAKVKTKNPLTNWLANIIVSITLSSMQDSVINDINGSITKALESSLSELNANLGPTSSS